MAKSSKQPKKSLSRKETRKQDRLQKKGNKRNNNNNAVKDKLDVNKSSAGPFKKLIDSKKSVKPKPKAPLLTIDPVDEDDLEIARLSKLLGIDKSKERKKIADKLNKEFELYEGIGDDFGDFLMDLDDLTESIKEPIGNYKKVLKDLDEVKQKDRGVSHHLIDDDMQEESDIDRDESGEDEDDDNSNSQDDMYEKEYSDDDQEDNDAIADVDEDDSDIKEDGENDEGEEEEEEEEDENEDEDENNYNNQDDDEKDVEEEEDFEQYTYQPSRGEDIYGKDTSGDVQKYVPPAKRKELLHTIDENSESFKLLKRQITSLMNKLSDQSKDSIIRSLKTIFDNNSITICNTILRDCILAACANPTQLMTSLIPIYASVVAALHLCVGVEVGAFVIENLAKYLYKTISETKGQITKDNESKLDAQHYNQLISNKLPSNSLLLLVYLYNLRVVYHTLIVDIMVMLSSNITSDEEEKYLEMKIELLMCLINHCGSSIRSDDPVSLKNVITELSKTFKHIILSDNDNNKLNNEKINSRVKFMFEALTELKNNKSRRIQIENGEAVKSIRKWLGSLKSILGHKSGDSCLRVTLQDLLDADNRGRWWKAGASWVGRVDKESLTNDRNVNNNTEADSVTNPKKKKGTDEKEDILFTLAKKMQMNTQTRKTIFVVVMSSRDVSDAFERLMRLDLKGKQDREIVRVIIECCGQEKTYNPFYSELSKILCSNNRQYKTTFQFAFWDSFKVMSNDTDNKYKKRRILNLSRMLSQLVGSFSIPLSVVLKTIDITELNEALILFFSSFFMSFFKEKISEEDFQNCLDRVATTKDFAVIRDNILFFLQKYLTEIPEGLEAEETLLIKKRRKKAIKTMEAMSILDISMGLEDKIDDN